MQNTTAVPRDYLDDTDVDETLDLIRTVSRDDAKELYKATLKCAHSQGRVDGGQAIKDLAEKAIYDVATGYEIKIRELIKGLRNETRQ